MEWNTTQPSLIKHSFHVLLNQLHNVGVAHADVRWASDALATLAPLKWRT